MFHDDNKYFTANMIFTFLPFFLIFYTKRYDIKYFIDFITSYFKKTKNKNSKYKCFIIKIVMNVFHLHSKQHTTILDGLISN